MASLERAGTDPAVAKMSPDDLLAALDHLGIAHTSYDHEAVFTVEQARTIRDTLPAGAHSKNLFLRSRKGGQWLLTCLEDRRLDLKALARLLGADRLSFGSPERLWQALGVLPGAVTPFAVANDPGGAVTLVLDQGFREFETCFFHPLVNTRTTALTPRGLLDFCRSVGHEPRILDLGPALRGD